MDKPIDREIATNLRSIPRNAPPKYLTGSLLRHILVMTTTSGLGLMAIFLSDLANIYFLSLLGDEAIVAAVGYASSILFLTISIGIGLSIAATALVSPALGAHKRVRACRMSVNAHLWAFVVSVALSAVVWVSMPWLLELLGAKGRTLALAERYLNILYSSTAATCCCDDFGRDIAICGRRAARHERYALWRVR